VRVVRVALSSAAPVSPLRPSKPRLAALFALLAVALVVVVGHVALFSCPWAAPVVRAPALVQHARESRCTKTKWAVHHRHTGPSLREDDDDDDDGGDDDGLAQRAVDDLVGPDAVMPVVADVVESGEIPLLGHASRAAVTVPTPSGARGPPSGENPS
jgi:hypothetical protein